MEKIGAASEKYQSRTQNGPGAGERRGRQPDRGGLIGGVTKVSDGQASI